MPFSRFVLSSPIQDNNRSKRRSIALDIQRLAFIVGVVAERHLALGCLDRIGQSKTPSAETLFAQSIGTLPVLGFWHRFRICASTTESTTILIEGINTPRQTSSRLPSNGRRPPSL